MTYFCPWDPVFLGYYKAILMATAVFSLAVGIFLLFKPKKAIDLQIAAYRLINWKMEPIHLKWEIFSTRAMGVLSLACAVAILFLVSRKYP